MPITRVTLFKIPEAAHRAQLLGMYKTMQRDALKVILSLFLLTNSRSTVSC